MVILMVIAVRCYYWASGGMVDTPDSKSCELYAREGSSPSSPTNKIGLPCGSLILFLRSGQVFPKNNYMLGFEYRYNSYYG